ncbi:DUF2059 domain-containing protein [Phenylobacterium deserti]|uniref:DUF2059 domain-containing protein n=1 Tax=Phenylobacterium deserti TaxID=1914756 RepID=A0A328A8F4_9CAUL|nr:DUF2059 domain-containing protein [Phenylobacterium deserti]RAK50862.1 hypothetical protein DJ018_16960 [Phenylobacterium deserti]
MSQLVRAALCAVALVVSATPALAQSAAPTPKSLELARRYIAALNMDRTMTATMQGLAPILVASLEKRTGSPAPAGFTDAFAQSSTEAVAVVMPSLIERMAPVVAASFTEAELEAGVAYYESPLGRSMMAKVPAYTGKVQPVIAELMPQMQDELRERLCKRIDCGAD